ncbi:MAG: proline dehydrogenase [Allosphingosinicella sp.]
MKRPWAALRTARYALPNHIERILPGPGPDSAARRCRSLNRRGLGATLGYFQSSADRPETIVAANLAVARLLSDGAGDIYLSVKAPPMAFDRAHLRRIAEAGAKSGLKLLFDAHAPKDADSTVTAVAGLLGQFPGTGLAIPARWRRSMADASGFRESSARIRLVKGEWPDPDGDCDIGANYVALAERLAGRAAPVAVATHDPALAERALTLLLEAGTPCELEQLRGLPSRRTMAVARRLGVPVRVYVPFGPGWWAYAADKALGRPYLLSWMIRDRLGRA